MGDTLPGGVDVDFAVSSTPVPVMENEHEASLWQDGSIPSTFTVAVTLCTASPVVSIVIDDVPCPEAIVPADTDHL
jgi:hypothetical protein